MTERSTLESVETDFYDRLATATSDSQIGDSLIGLSITHAQMELSKLPLSLKELYAGIHGRAPHEALGILALYGGIVLNSGINPLTSEHMTVARNRKHS